MNWNFCVLLIVAKREPKFSIHQIKAHLKLYLNQLWKLWFSLGNNPGQKHIEIWYTPLDALKKKYFFDCFFFLFESINIIFKKQPKTKYNKTNSVSSIEKKSLLSKKIVWFFGYFYLGYILSHPPNWFYHPPRYKSIFQKFNHPIKEEKSKIYYLKVWSSNFFLIYLGEKN